MYFAKTNLSSGRGKRAPGYRPNQRIPDDAFSEAEFDRLVKAGAVSKVDPAEVTEKVTVGQNTTLDRALWTFLPEDLADVDLPTANMMIAQHVKEHGIKDVDPFTDLDEAIAWMTQDTES